MSFISNSKVYMVSFPYTPEDEMIKLCQDFNTRTQRDQLDLEAKEMIANTRTKLQKYINEKPATCGIAYQTDCDGATNPWIAIRALSEDHLMEALDQTGLFDKILEVHEHGKTPIRESKLV